MKSTTSGPPRLCTYTVNFDSGHAPNPFWGFCTLGLCTPNYVGMSESLERGDWIMGHASVRAGRGIIYAMRISNVLDFDKYFRDKRFARKKPRRTGSDKQRCGDNIYHLENGRWIQHPYAIHGHRERRKDLWNHAVILSRHFYYFGENGVPIPDRFQSLCVGRGCKYRHDENVVSEFLNWLTTKFPPGVHGNPRDWPLEEQSTC